MKAQLGRDFLRSSLARTARKRLEPRHCQTFPRRTNPLSPFAPGRMLRTTATMEATNYRKWTKESLIQRIRSLEGELGAQRATTTAALQPAAATEATAEPPKKKAKKAKKAKEMDPSKYSSRFIALKFAYLGRNYNGYEFTANAALSTVEEELWKALVKACLIFPKNPNEVDWEGCEYSKCGRTDKGVSAFGQVIGIRVRSNRPLPKERVAEQVPELPGENEGERTEGVTGVAAEEAEVADQGSSFDPVLDEISYCRVLNRLLPPDIRVLAWCPSPPPGFSARFSCRERQYRYFFTQPAFAPVPSGLETKTGRTKAGWLDIGAMRDAAAKFEGLHDFRNFCKVDPNKLTNNFERRIFEAKITEVKDVDLSLSFLARGDLAPESSQNTPDGLANLSKVYSFDVRGSAFLWHQIRHMVAILFLVGQGLEPPAIVDQLLDVQVNPRRPNYVMADEVPLVLWDCLFPAEDEGVSEGGAAGHREALDWVRVGEDTPLSLYGPGGLVTAMWRFWRGRKMDEVLANRLFERVAAQADLSHSAHGAAEAKEATSTLVFDGGDAGKPAGAYVPVLKLKLMDTPEELCDRWARRKGFKSAEEMRGLGNWRQAIKDGKAGEVAE